jgi:hypothetical protein
MEWPPGVTVIWVSTDRRPLRVTVTCVLWPGAIVPEDGVTESRPIRLEGIVTA